MVSNIKSVCPEKEKTSHRWEKVLVKDAAHKGVLRKIYKNPTKLNSKKRDNSILKMG